VHFLITFSDLKSAWRWYKTYFQKKCYTGNNHNFLMSMNIFVLLGSETIKTKQIWSKTRQNKNKNVKRNMDAKTCETAWLCSAAKWKICFCKTDSPKLGVTKILDEFHLNTLQKSKDQGKLQPRGMTTRIPTTHLSAWAGPGYGDLGDDGGVLTWWWTLLNVYH